MANSGYYNSGDCNSGDCNSGNRNSGNRNSGNYNSGDFNSGDRNSGDCNSGNRNSGNYNSGYCNSGDCNSGDCNSGDCNSGDCNSGDRNSGDCNSGDFNSGYFNTGNFNTGNFNSGYFCTDTPKPQFFDLPCDLSWDEATELVPYLELPVLCEWVSSDKMTDEEKSSNPNHDTIGGYLKSSPLPLTESFPVAWANASSETRNRFLSLPNFNPDKFLEITGVDVRTNIPSEASPSDEITLNGKRFRLVPID